jgi:hypothetical protein
LPTRSIPAVVVIGGVAMLHSVTRTQARDRSVHLRSPAQRQRSLLLRDEQGKTVPRPVLAFEVMEFAVARQQSRM